MSELVERLGARIHDAAVLLLADEGPFAFPHEGLSLPRGADLLEGAELLRGVVGPLEVCDTDGQEHLDDGGVRLLTGEGASLSGRVPPETLGERNRHYDRADGQAPEKPIRASIYSHCVSFQALGGEQFVRRSYRSAIGNDTQI